MDIDIIVGIGTGVVLAIIFFWTYQVGKGYNSEKK